MSGAGDSLLLAAGGERWSGSQLWRSADGGRSWIAVDPGVNQCLYDISMVTPSLAYACGNGGKLLKTLDGGKSWTVYQEPAWQAMRGIAGQGDSLVICVQGANYNRGRIVISTDGGDQWRESATFTLELRDVVFTGPRTAVAAGYGAILRSSDGGRTWNYSDAEGDFFVALSFPDPDTGFAIGRNGRLLRSTDGGERWQCIHNAPAGIRRGFHDVFFPTPRRGFISGDDGRLLYSDDGGKSWRNIEAAPGGASLLALYAASENRVWAGGSGPKIFQVNF